MNSRWLILDANYLAHRARYSMGELSWKGAATGVVYGFLQTVIHLQNRFDTDHVAFCFDSRYSKRKKLYPPYKANRREDLTEKELEFEREFRRQIILLRKEYLPEIGFRNIFLQTGYEADDLIAIICEMYFLAMEYVIVTADEDLFQCITGQVSCFNPHKNELMTLQKFWSIYQINPPQWALIKALAGCSSDNIPGIRGIGEKTALRYVRGTLKFGSKAENAITGAQEVGEPLDTYMKLVKLPFEGTKNPLLQSDNISVEGWRSVCKRLGFKSLEFRIPQRR